MARTPLSALTTWITDAALQHPATLPAHVAQRLDVSRSTARRLLERLVDAQWLCREGTAQRRVHRPGLLRQVVRRYRIAGLDGHAAWSSDFAPALALADGVARQAQQVVTALVDNAVRHSGGSGVTVSVRQTAAHVQLLVSDDGCGLFERAAQQLHWDEPHEPAHAMEHLGRGTRGLSSVVQIADVLDIHANGQALQHRAWQRDRWQSGRPAVRQGTTVFVAMALDRHVEPDAPSSDARVLRSRSTQRDLNDVQPMRSA